MLFNRNRNCKRAAGKHYRQQFYLCRIGSDLFQLNSRWHVEQQQLLCSNNRINLGYRYRYHCRCCKIVLHTSDRLQSNQNSYCKQPTCSNNGHQLLLCGRICQIDFRDFRWHMVFRHCSSNCSGFRNCYSNNSGNLGDQLHIGDRMCEIHDRDGERSTSGKLGQ